jgi:hypothetical protein
MALKEDGERLSPAVLARPAATARFAHEGRLDSRAAQATLHRGLSRSEGLLLCRRCGEATVREVLLGEPEEECV